VNIHTALRMINPASAWAPPPGQAAWYGGPGVTYNEATEEDEWTDLLGNGNHAALISGAAVNANGLDLSQDADARGLVADYAGIQLAEWTVCLWVYPITISGTRVLFSKPTFQTGVYANLETTYRTRLFWRNSADALHFGPLSLESWSHFAYTRDGDGDTTIRYNGGTAATDTMATDTVAIGDLLIGRNQEGQAFDGYIDDFGIWSRALSQEEIQDQIENSPWSHA
jgi:hypothetical protein